MLARNVGEECGRGMWERNAGEESGRGMWERNVGEQCGRGRWERKVGEECGRGMREMNVGEESVREMWESQTCFFLYFAGSLLLGGGGGVLKGTRGNHTNRMGRVSNYLVTESVWKHTTIINYVSSSFKLILLVP